MPWLILSPLSLQSSRDANLDVLVLGSCVPCALWLCLEQTDGVAQAAAPAVCPSCCAAASRSSW